MEFHDRSKKINLSDDADREFLCKKISDLEAMIREKDSVKILFTEFSFTFVSTPEISRPLPSIEISWTCSRLDCLIFLREPDYHANFLHPHPLSSEFASRMKKER